MGRPYLDGKVGTSPEAAPSGRVKAKLYGLAAVVCARVIDRAIANRPDWPPFGLIAAEGKGPVSALDPLDPFGDLRSRMQGTLLLALDQELRHLDGLVAAYGEPASQRESYLQFKHLAASPASPFHSSPRGFIGAGLNTGIDVMSKVLRVVPEVTGRDRREDLLPIARNSYHLVVNLSMKHIRDFALVMRALEAGTDGSRFNPERFVLRRSASGLSLAIPSLDENPGTPPPGFRSSFGEEDPVVGCPAMTNFDGTPAIRKLWEWHLEIAEEIYRSG